MSSNLETVKKMYAAFGRGDIATIVANMADDVVWAFEANPTIAWAGIRRGPQEAVGFFEGIDKDVTGNKLDMTEFFVDGDKVAAFGRYEATVRKNGIRVSSPVAHYFRFRDGKVVEYRNLLNTAAFSDAMNASSATA
jgi:ketosteroid isomerase-like protein